MEMLYKICINKECRLINFNAAIDLIILVNKFCWVENCHMPTVGQNKGNFYLIPDDNLVSYNEKEVVHCKLTLQTKQYFSAMLYHFINEPLENVESKTAFDSTFGTSYKPLGSRRIKMAEYIITTFNLMKAAIVEIDALLVQPENIQVFGVLLVQSL